MRLDACWRQLGPIAELDRCPRWRCSRLLQTQLHSGLTRKDLAAALEIGQSQLREFISLGKLIPDLQDLAGWGRDDSGGFCRRSHHSRRWRV